MSWKSMLKMALITMGVMFVANQASAMNSTLRRVLKGNVVSPVGNASNSSTTIAV